MRQSLTMSIGPVRIMYIMLSNAYGVGHPVLLLSVPPCRNQRKKLQSDRPPRDVSPRHGKGRDVLSDGSADNRREFSQNEPSVQG
jgi:hypothetical protein